MVPYGNHIRGSLFLDSTYKNTKLLEALIDRVCKSVDSFYYGRLDIRFNSFEELVADSRYFEKLDEIKFEKTILKSALIVEFKPEFKTS